MKFNLHCNLPNFRHASNTSALLTLPLALSVLLSARLVRFSSPPLLPFENSAILMFSELEPICSLLAARQKWPQPQDSAIGYLLKIFLALSRQIFQEYPSSLLNMTLWALVYIYLWAQGSHAKTLCVIQVFDKLWKPFFNFKCSANLLVWCFLANEWLFSNNIYVVPLYSFVYQYPSLLNIF